MISDEAVELAARAIFQQTHEEPWEDEPDYYRRQFIRNARAALEAAAPYIAAETWDRAAASIVDEHGNPIIPTNIDNPYRSQA